MAAGVSSVDIAVTTAMYQWTDRDIERAWLSRSFKAFVKAAWHVAEPGVRLIWSPYMDGICDHMQALAESWEIMNGRLNFETMIADESVLFRNLLINIPPRMLKSTLCSVLWPVWLWTRNPTIKLLTSSYSVDLARRDAVASRGVIQSVWFQSLWGDTVRLSSDQNQKSRYNNTMGGYRIAVGKQSGTTGDGADILLADDPENAADVFSPSAMDQTKQWFGNIWSNRMNDAKRSCMVVIQQRIHEDDLSGSLIEQGDWVHLNLPMQYEVQEEKSTTIIGWQDPRTEEGEYLAPERYGDAEKASTVRRAGESGWNTQYQQRPTPKGGGILKEKNWYRYHRHELPEEFIRVAAFADTATKEKESNDYSVIALWGETEDRWWLLDLVRERMEFPKLQKTAMTKWEQWRKLPVGMRPTRFVVEEASSGVQLIQVFKATTKIPIVGHSVRGDKVLRANNISGYHEAGLLAIPAHDDDGVGVFDVDEFVREHAVFPKGRHDDMVDTTTQMLHYFHIDDLEEDDDQSWIAVTSAKGRW